MSFGIPNTPDNHALAAVVSRRIGADSRRTGAIAMVYRCLGIGALGLLLGGGAGLALWGYSYVSDGRTSMEKLSTALADALDRANLKVTGNVTLDTQDASVPLTTNGATVGLDTHGATVGVDTRGATVGVDTKNATIPLDPNSKYRPSDQQMAPQAAPASRATPVTNYTIFKHIDYAGGEVITGWRFHNNEEPTPFHQYCYYTTKTENNVATQFILAINRTASMPRNLPVNYQGGLANCVWYDAAPPASPPTPPANAPSAPRAMPIPLFPNRT